MNKRDTEALVASHQLTCRHFLGLQKKVCEAGVDYSTMRDVSAPGMAHWPCLPGRRPCVTVCPKRELHTEEQARALVAAMDKAIEDALSNIGAGRCHECGKAIEPSQIVGRCKYGACGHRIGQVLDDEHEAS